MVSRFKVRQDGPTAWGVWDGAANGWRGRDLSKQQAHDLAADLELQYDAHGQRPPETVRRVTPPCAVDQMAWKHGGLLEAWVRERGEWLGRVRAPDGSISWVPASELRRALER